MGLQFSAFRSSISVDFCVFSRHLMSVPAWLVDIVFNRYCNMRNARAFV